MPKKKITPAQKYQFVGLKNIYAMFKHELADWTMDDDLTKEQVEAINTHLFRAYDNAGDKGQESINDIFETLTGRTFEELRDLSH